MGSVIFDLDGVLVDSEPYWQEAFAGVANEWCVSHGIANPRLTAPQMRRFEGGRVSDTVTTVLTELAGRPLTPLEVADATDRVVDLATRAFAKRPTLIQPSVEVARQLARQGARLGLASSSAPRFIDVALNEAGLTDAFAVTQSALYLEHGKPDPEVYRLTLARLGESADESLAVEDSIRGLISAIRAELRVIWLVRDDDEDDTSAYARLQTALSDAMAEPPVAADVARIVRRLRLADFGPSRR
jgi:HAD superfamily hydrolase (TIGR01509 family)